MNDTQILLLSGALHILSISIAIGIGILLLWQGFKVRLNQFAAMWLFSHATNLSIILLNIIISRLLPMTPEISTAFIQALTLSLLLSGVALFVTTLEYAKPWTKSVRRWLVGLLLVLFVSVGGTAVFAPQLLWDVNNIRLNVFTGLPDIEAGLSVGIYFLIALISVHVIGTLIAAFSGETHRLARVGISILTISPPLFLVAPFIQINLGIIGAIAGQLCITYAIMDEQLFDPLRVANHDLVASKAALEKAYATVEKQVKLRTHELEQSLDREQALAKQLELALALEKELSQLSSRIITTVSHEFRTPLTIITNAAYMLTQHDKQLTLDKREAQYGRIREAIFSLTDMLQDVLMVNTTKQSGIQPQLAVYKLQDLYQQISRDLMEEVSHLNIVFNCEGEGHQLVKTDAKLVKKIVFNLLSNAIKYSSPTAPIAINCQYQQQTLHISVKDQGIGIVSHEMPNLFELFYRGSNVENRRGLGLGLYIVRQLSQGLGGTVTAVSPGINQGSTFTVTLPMTTDMEVV